MQGWYFGGGLKDKAGPALQSPEAVKLALEKAPDRPVKLSGIDRALNETPQTLEAWQYSKGPVSFYLDSGGEKNRDDAAKAKFGVPYARLDDGDKEGIRNSIKTQLRRDPELAAWLKYWGVLEAKQSDAAETRLLEIQKRYGK